MNKHALFAFIGTIVLIWLIGCDTECGQTKQDSSSEHSQDRVYKLEDVQLDSVAYTLTAKTDAPDGTEFTVELNNQAVTAKAYQNTIEFNVTPCFDPMYSLGGNNYQAKFACASLNISPREISLPYWPKLIGELQSYDIVSVWNGSADKLLEPVVYVNYEDKTYNFEEWYDIYDSNDALIETHRDWRFEDMQSYMSDDSHIGSSVLSCAKATPVRDGIPQTELAAGFEIKYLYVNDLLVKSAAIDISFGKLEVIAYDESGDIVGGKIKYEWQTADSVDADDNAWRTINESMPTHSVAKDELGKYMRVKLTQNYNDESQDMITTAAILVQNIFIPSGIILKYNKVLSAGTVPNVADITGYAFDTFGEYINASDMTFTFTDVGYLSSGISYSDYVGVSFGKNGFYDASADVFITVQRVMTENEMPSLSLDVNNIPLGKVKFDWISDQFECSVNDGLSWENMPNNVFDAKEGDEILIRKKSFGKPNVCGYLMASEPLTIMVQTSNIGKQSEMSGLNIDIKEMSLILTTKTAADGDIVVTANVENYNIAQEYIPRKRYAWKIDGVAVTSETDYAAVQDNTLTLHKSKLITGETYQVSLTLIVDSDYYTELDGEEAILLILSAQESVQVE